MTAIATPQDTAGMRLKFVIRSAVYSRQTALAVDLLDAVATEAPLKSPFFRRQFHGAITSPRVILLSLLRPELPQIGRRPLGVLLHSLGSLLQGYGLLRTGIALNVIEWPLPKTLGIRIKSHLSIKEISKILHVGNQFSQALELRNQLLRDLPPTRIFPTCDVENGFLSLVSMHNSYAQDRSIRLGLQLLPMFDGRLEMGYRDWLLEGQRQSFENPVGLTAGVAATFRLLHAKREINELILAFPDKRFQNEVRKLFGHWISLLRTQRRSIFTMIEDWMQECLVWKASQTAQHFNSELFLQTVKETRRGLYRDLIALLGSDDPPEREREAVHVQVRG